MNVGQRIQTGHSLNTAHARRHATFGRDGEQANVTRALHVGATAEFAAGADVQHAHGFAVLLAKQHHGTGFLGRFNVHHAGLGLGIGQHLGVHDVLNLANLSIGDRRGVREVKPSALRVHQAAFLLHMVTQHFAQGFVHQVRGAVVAHGCGTGRFIHLRHNGVTHLERTGAERAVVAKHIGLDFLGVGHVKQNARRGELAGIAHLTAALCVKRRGVQHHNAILTRLKLGHGCAARIQRDHFGILCGQAVIADKVIAVAGVLQRAVHLELARCTPLGLLLFHGGFEALFID